MSAETPTRRSFGSQVPEGWGTFELGMFPPGECSATEGWLRTSTTNSHHPQIAQNIDSTETSALLCMFRWFTMSQPSALHSSF